MVNMIILGILLIGIYSGARRGLLLQLVHTVGYIVTWILATLLYPSLSKSLERLVPYPSDVVAKQFALYNLVENMDFDKAFYNGLSFVMILIAGGIIIRLIAATLKPIVAIPVLRQLNLLGGAGLGFIGNWLGLYIILTLLSLVPFGSVQNIFATDSLATYIVKNTPIISDTIVTYWVK